MNDEAQDGGEYRVLVSGSRDWLDGDTIRRALVAVVDVCTLPVVVIHGAARGADATADAVARGLGLEVRGFPADWRGQGKAAGHIRNRLMLDQRPDVVLAFKDGFNWSLNRGGTENMVKIASEAGVPVLVHDRGEAHWVLLRSFGASPGNEVTYG